MALDREQVSEQQIYKHWQQTGLGVREYYRKFENWLNSVGLCSENAWVGLRWRINNKIRSASTFSPALQKPRTLELDQCMIVGDVHVPTTDIEMFTNMLRVATKHLKTPRTLIIAGDLFNMDAFSDYEPELPLPSFRDEKRAAKAFIDDCLTVFDHIYYFMGNHERRITKKTKGQISPDELADMLGSYDNVTVSGWGWVNLTSGGEQYRITHAKNYSVQQLNVADTLTFKFRRHIIQHHEHHVAKGWDRYKWNIVINNGGLFNVDAIGYIQLDDSKSPNMTPGFTMLRDGVADVFGRYPYTDWSRWL